MMVVFVCVGEDERVAIVRAEVGDSVCVTEELLRLTVVSQVAVPCVREGAVPELVPSLERLFLVDDIESVVDLLPLMGL